MLPAFYKAGSTLSLSTKMMYKIKISLAIYNKKHQLVVNLQGEMLKVTLYNLPTILLILFLITPFPILRWRIVLSHLLKKHQ